MGQDGEWLVTPEKPASVRLGGPGRRATTVQFAVAKLSNGTLMVESEVPKPKATYSKVSLIFRSPGDLSAIALPKKLIKRISECSRKSPAREEQAPSSEPAITETA
jgi:hypothetical protein